MTEYALRPSVLLVFLAAAVFLAMTVWLMLGPLLVELATVFHTSVAVTGQLTAATAITWALTAFLAGPVSDIYGRRRMLLTGLMLMALGTLSAAFAWNFGALLAFRCLTGVGGAMIPPNCLATIADVFPPAQRGKAMGWVMSAMGLGTAFGVPLVALLSDIGGWRVPFYVIGALLLLLWGLLWVWFPDEPARALRLLCRALPGGGRQGRLVVCPGNQLFAGHGLYRDVQLSRRLFDAHLPSECRGHRAAPDPGGSWGHCRQSGRGPRGWPGLSYGSGGDGLCGGWSRSRRGVHDGYLAVGHCHVGLCCR